MWVYMYMGKSKIVNIVKSLFVVIDISQGMLGFKVWGSGFRVKSLEFRVWGSIFKDLEKFRVNIFFNLIYFNN